MIFHNGQELLELTEKNGVRISDIAIKQAMKDNDASEEAVRALLQQTIDVMMHSAEKGTEEEIHSISGMSGGYAKKAMDYAKEKEPLMGKTMMRTVAAALSTSEVNAGMGRICAAPTAGSSGILPSALHYLKVEKNATDKELVDALLTASAVGLLVEVNATVSGAEGGCQAECGTAAAMAAAALVEFQGGTPREALDAAGFSFMNIMGLVCDPIGGFVEFPCSIRNASGVMNAIVSADLALSGCVSLIPFDEVVDSMFRVGRALPEALRETGKGGVAITPTGIKLRNQYLKKDR
ncbi:L-serine ammonia-lyase, iron-sulfur-dependent, subunit alpha [Guggenheimella bovis]